MTTTMMNQLATIKYETLLIQLAQAMEAGDKLRANAIRIEMELPERELDEAMMDRFDGLSADLYMLEDKEYFEYQQALASANAYIADETTPPALLIGSAAVLIQTAQHAKEATAEEQVLAAVPALVRALSSKAGLDFSPIEVIALGYVSLGFCLEFLGDVEKANSAYRFALMVDPGNSAAQEALRKRLSGQNKSTPFNITVPSAALEGIPSNTSFQTLRAQQIWLATGSD